MACEQIVECGIAESAGERGNAEDADSRFIQIRDSSPTPGADGDDNEEDDEGEEEDEDEENDDTERIDTGEPPMEV